jgi:hypothetical protein
MSEKSKVSLCNRLLLPHASLFYAAAGLHVLSFFSALIDKGATLGTTYWEVVLWITFGIDTLVIGGLLLYWLLYNRPYGSTGPSNYTPSYYYTILGVMTSWLLITVTSLVRLYEYKNTSVCSIEDFHWSSYTDVNVGTVCYHLWMSGLNGIAYATAVAAGLTFFYFGVSIDKTTLEGLVSKD